MEKVKTKVRFTSLDVAAMVQNMQKLLGMRATNIYDLNPSTYIIKLARSEQKNLLLIENGVRFHTVHDKQEKKTIPSGFTMKFRKYLRSKRLESIRQVGVERVVVFSFGTEAYANHLILELYSQGNIILTDNNYKIIQCIRSHEFNDKVKTAVGEVYPFQYAAHIYLENIDISSAKIQEFLQKIEAKNNQEPAQNQKQLNAKKKKKNATTKKQSAIKLRDIVFKMIPCLFPNVIDNILIKANIDPNKQISAVDIEQINEACKHAYKFLKDFLKSSHAGYLYGKEPKQIKQIKDKQEEQKNYFEYSSYEQINLEKNNYIKHQMTSFNDAVGQYYKYYKKPQAGQIEEQFEQLAWRKYDQIKKDQQNRLKKLQQEQDIYKVKAEYIEKNVDDVQAIIKIVKTMEDNGYSWEDIKRMVSESKKNGDPLANMIHELDIGKRQVTILLGDTTDEEQLFELLPVEINIDYNAYTNATIYYESKKKNYQKEKRTKEASQQVLKIAEKDAIKIIEKKKNEQLAKSVPTRKQFWFEKFYWFISSEGFLVISGRDSHQNQLLVKRYMKPGDLYMHSDYGGAASTVVKNHEKNMIVPRGTLEEAAIFTVCRSKAWDTKIMSGAWWVYHDQVSKSAPTGQFLPTGSFMIRGKKNFIQPNRMQMGITLLYKIDQESAKRHVNDRRIHMQEIKQQLQQNQRVALVKQEQQSQQFSIVTLDTTKFKGPKNQKGKQPEQSGINKNQTPASKIESENQSKDSDDDKQSDDEEEAHEKYQNKKAATIANNKAKKNSKNQQQQQPKQKMRNKRKLKKLEKYMQEQDQEEREIIMKMIGAREMKQFRTEEEVEDTKDNKNKKKKKDKNKKKGLEKYIGNNTKQQLQQKLNPDKVLFLKKKKQQDEISSSSDQQLPEKATQSQKQAEKPQKDTEKQQDNNSQQKEAEEQKPEQQDEEAKEKEENNLQEASDNDEEQIKQEQTKQQQPKQQEQEEIDQKILDSEIAQLNKLIGKIHPQDKYDNLVTMCAPYNSIKQNRFKIKLVPGGLKKGKAARNILHYFLNACDVTESEKPFVRSLPEQEVINALLGNVKLAGAGLLKIQQKEKAEKKEKKKDSERKVKNN